MSGMKYHAILIKQNGDIIDQGDFEERAEIRRWATGRTRDYPDGEPRVCYRVRVYEGDELVSSFVEV